MQNKKSFAIISFIMTAVMVFTFSFSLLAAAGSDKPFTGEEFEIVDDCEHVLSDELKYDENTHWNTCTLCDKKKNEASHTLRPKNNDTHHWSACAFCGFVSEKEAHKPDDEGKCTECIFGKGKLGDINDDGDPGATDLVLLRRSLADLPNDKFNTLAADIDGNGKITAADLVLLRRIIAGLYDTGAGE